MSRTVAVTQKGSPMDPHGLPGTGAWVLQHSGFMVRTVIEAAATKRAA